MTQTEKEWHVEFFSRVPLSIFGVILAQSVGWAWFASSWKADLDQWRTTTSQQISLLSAQTPATQQEVAVLRERITTQERWQSEMKSDLVRRLERQDAKLDSIATRLDALKNGGRQ